MLLQCERFCSVSRKNKSIVCSLQISRKPEKAEILATDASCRTEQLRLINLFIEKWRCAMCNRRNVTPRGEGRVMKLKSYADAMKYSEPN